MKNKYQTEIKTGKASLDKNKEAYFFYSADCYDELGNKTTYVHGFMGFNTKETEEMMKDPFEFILNHAKTINNKVVSVHILALNKI